MSEKAPSEEPGGGCATAKARTVAIPSAETQTRKLRESLPVVKIDEEVLEFDIGPIDESSVSTEETPLPTGFKWSSIDATDDAQLEEFYQFLKEHYVENERFRFECSKAFLRWAMMPPGFDVNMHIAVRNAKSGGLLATIIGIPMKVRTFDKVANFYEINFLCVHKKLRTKRIVPVLVREARRRMALNEHFQPCTSAICTSREGFLARPFGKCTYWHRPLNMKKLIEAEFKYLTPKMTLARSIKLYKLPDTPELPLVPLSPADIFSAYGLMSRHLTKFKLVHMQSLEEFAHFFLPVEDAIDTYCLKDGDGKVTDICSFYHLPSQVLNNVKVDKLNLVYSYYNVAMTVPLVTLMRDSMVLAKNKGVDCFYSIDIMESSQYLKELKFEADLGSLHYYMYNWKCADIDTHDLGLVLP